MLKVVGMKEIDAVFEVIDRLEISREMIKIPLSPESPGKIRKLPNGKIEITVDAETPLEEWVLHLETELRKLV